MDARLEVVHKDSSGAPQQDYGIVRFDENTFQLVGKRPYGDGSFGSARGAGNVGRGRAFVLR